MDHEVVPRPHKFFYWLLNSSHDHCGLHQEKNVIVTMKFKVPKKHRFSFLVNKNVNRKHLLGTPHDLVVDVLTWFGCLYLYLLIGGEVIKKRRENLKHFFTNLIILYLKIELNLVWFWVVALM